MKRSRYIECIRDLILASLLVLVRADRWAYPGRRGPRRNSGCSNTACCWRCFSRWAGAGRPERVLPRRPGFVVIGLFLAYLFGRAWLDPRRDYALDQFLTFASWLIFAGLIAGACPTPARFARMLRIMAVGQLGPVILAVGNIFGTDIYLHWILRQPGWKWGSELIGADRGIIWSSLGNPNFYANYGAMLLIGLLTLLVLTRRRWIRALWGLYAGILLLTLVYTFTRGIWASLVLLPFILGIWGRPARPARQSHVRDPAPWKARGGVGIGRRVVSGRGLRGGIQPRPVAQDRQALPERR